MPFLYCSFRFLFVVLCLVKESISKLLVCQQPSNQKQQFNSNAQHKYVPPPAMMNIAPNPGQFQQPRPQFLPPQQQAIETRNIYRGHHSRPEDTDRPASYCCE
ncbi:hypothetical protein DEO72_LG9g1383 [Vigna unguiculata]|uniref:Secreted protein n=1 Tax=Vigna unguiculata TaxID=3917 RepID=A0A4D6N0K2_VIGUN|nr:hypothetical protein DEO72_LG9g1383 [Vigna unguiculata]